MSGKVNRRFVKIGYHNQKGSEEKNLMLVREAWV